MAELASLGRVGAILGRPETGERDGLSGAEDGRTLTDSGWTCTSNGGARWLLQDRQGSQPGIEGHGDGQDDVGHEKTGVAQLLLAALDVHVTM